jgi:hypothetical protein
MKEINQLQFYQGIQFSERLNEVNLWVSKAKELLHAANCLKSILNSQWSKVKIENGKLIVNLNEPLVQGPYFMLVAYAIENLLKAIIIHRKKAKLKNRLLLKIPDNVHGHDLLKLANKIGIQLDISEQKLLARLTQNSIWSARYPIPLEATDMRTTVKLLNGQNYFSAYFAPNDLPEIDSFLEKLLKIVSGELNIAI